MHNVLQILRRDFKRLVTVPAAWVIMIGLILIPPLYAWFNIYGFWNPYGNTDSIKVAVANMDKGTDNALLGKVNLGDQIEGTLKSNDQLGWEFMGKANAMEAVESGDCYAAIVIPSDFSEDLANVVTNSKHRPTLEYYVNEKASPISPKITDQGATVVDRTVNNTFVSTVSDVLVKAVNSANGTISGNTNATANETIGELDNTKRNVGTIRSAIADLDTQLANVPQQTKAARNALNDVQLAAASAGRGLAGASTAIGTAQTQLNTLSSNANSALETGSGLVSQATAQSTASINQISSAVSAASGSAQQAVTGMQNRQQCETAREAQIRQRQRAIPANHQQTGEYQQHGSRNTRRPQNPEREHTGHSRQRIQTVHRFQHRHAELAQKRRHGAQRHQFRRTAATEFRAGLAGWDGRNTCRHRDQPGQRGQANQHRARPTRPSGVRRPHRP